MRSEIYFLEAPTTRAEYRRIHSKCFPPDIKELYQIDGLIDKCGYVQIQIKEGVYVLKQVDVVLYAQFISHMEHYGYHLVPFTTRLWAHQIGKEKICPCVHNFRIIYFSKDDVDHLLNCLRKYYAAWTDC